MIRRKLAVLAGSVVVGLGVPVIFGIVSVALRGHGSREAVLQPFFWLSAPAFTLGEAVFGQAPIPILVTLGCYWMLLGALIGFLVLLGVNVMHKR